MPYQFIIFGEESSSGIGALGLNGQAFLIQLVTFLLVFWVLRRFAFKPILRVLQERREVIYTGVKLGEEMQKERAELDRQIADKLRVARAQADSIIALAQGEAREVVQTAEGKARQKAEDILADAESQIAQDTARMRQKLEKELVGLISEVTEAVVGEKVDTQKDRALIDKTLKARHLA